MMFNDAVAGTRLQPGIKGRGTVQLPDGSFREMQAFYTPRVPATEEQAAALSDHERAILTELRNVDSFWPRRVVDSALRGFDPEDDEQEMSFKTNPRIADCSGVGSPRFRPALRSVCATDDGFSSAHNG